MITKEMTMLEIKELLGNESDALMYGIPDWFIRNGNLNYYGLKQKHGAWQIDDMYDALNEYINIKHEVVWLQEHVGTIILHNNSEKNLVLLAGGGYGSVCTWAEGLPVAIDAYKKGFNVYLITYTVGEDSIFPKPIEDLALIMKYLINRFNIKDYWISGFSAGAHLSALWALDELGYKKYNLLKPSKEILVYPLILIDDTGDDIELEKLISKRVGGKYKQYNLTQYINSNYPKTYIVRGLNDSTLGNKHTKELTEAFNKYNIEYYLDEYNNADHGFGLGGNTEAKGWFDKAYEFLNK